MDHMSRERSLTKPYTIKIPDEAFVILVSALHAEIPRQARDDKNSVEDPSTSSG